MRQTLKLMGSNTKGSKSYRTPRTKRLRAPAPPKRGSLTARTSTSDDGNSSDDAFENAAPRKSTGNGGDLTNRRGTILTNRKPLDVITERQNTEENLFGRGDDSPTKTRSSPTKKSRESSKKETRGSPDGGPGLRKASEERTAVFGKRGSRASLQRGLSRRSIESEDDVAVPPGGGSSVLSKRNSVAALRAKRRRVSQVIC